MEYLKKTTLRHIIYIAFIGLFFSCSTDSQRENSNKETLSESDNGGSTSQTVELSDATELEDKSDEIKLTKTSDSSYCLIKEVFNQNNGTYLKVDFIQFYTFEQAIEEAKKRLDAEYDIEENGDTTYFVYNDYYIANDNPKLRTFRLTDLTKIEFLEVLGDTATNFKNAKKAMKRVEFSPFIIVSEVGKITRLKEIYTP
ncbi:MAG: hypothetical protein ACI9G9_000747 [Psychromonas sp.]